MPPLLFPRDRALFSALTLIDAEAVHDDAELAAAFETKYVPFLPDYALEAFRLQLAKGVLRAGDTMLELGAGRGDIVATGAWAGLKSYGLELEPRLVRRAESKFASLRENGILSPDASVRIAQGNYLPADYLLAHRAKRTVAWGFEEEHFPPCWHVSSAEDPYSRLGIAPNEVDVFFCYAWGDQVPSVWEFFSMYSKPDAILLNPTWHLPRHDDRLLDLLRLECTVDKELDGERWQLDEASNKIPIYLIRHAGQK